MKPILRRDHSYRFRPLRLFREDIDEVLSVLSQAGCEITLSDESKVYDSIDEMKSLAGANAGVLDIEARHPFVHVTFGKRRLNWLYRDDENSVYVEDSRPENELLFLKIRDYLKTRQRILPRLVNLAGLWLLAILFPLWRFFLSHRYVSDQVKRVDLWITVSFQLVYTFVYFAFAFKGWSVVNLESQKQRSSFWSRNRDEILKYFLFFALGYILNLLLSYLRSHH